ncbi:MAG: hypothetical protein RPR40_12810 [Bermanella sp.]
MSNKWTVNSEQSKADFMQHVSDMYDHHKYLTIDVKKGKPRTQKQNNALHKYLEQLSDALNEAGLDMKRTLKQDVEIPWTPVSVKEFMWRPVQKALYEVESTTKPKSDQYPKIYEALNRHTSMKLGIGLQWPDRGNHGN